jgi:tight adherence protein C
MMKAFGRLGRRLTPGSYVRSLEDRLARAGSGKTVEEVLAVKAIGAGAGLGIVAATARPGVGILFGVLAGTAGFIAADASLSRQLRRRTDAVLRALPDALDLMAVLTEAGVGLEGAIARAAEDVGGPLGAEFGRMLHEMHLGASRREALEALRARVDVPELGHLVLALLQADRLGIAVGKVLKKQAAQMRLKRRQLARERAAKTPVKILFPLIFGIFPAMMIVIVGPAALRVMDALLSR